MKIYIAFLSTFLATSILAGQALAADIASGTDCGTGCSWSLSDDGVLTVKGTDENSSINDYTSNSPAPWRSYKDSISAVNVDIKKIGNYAFYNLSSVKTLNISNSVTRIGKCAFKGMWYLQSLTIPDSVISIDEGAFDDMNSLQSLTISNSVTDIGYGTFSYMESLTELTIPDSVTTIGRSAFWGMESLTSLKIGKNVTSIGSYAFGGMSADAKICCGEKIYSELENNRSYYGLGDQELSICQSSDEDPVPDDSDPIDETCKILPSCEELGYVKGYQKECGTDEKNYVLCPYDKEYRKCVNYTCKGLGFTTDDKSSWCSDIVPCKYDSTYTLCKSLLPVL